jgi:hypothetical protein
MKHLPRQPKPDYRNTDLRHSICSLSVSIIFP